MLENPRIIKEPLSDISVENHDVSAHVIGYNDVKISGGGSIRSVSHVSAPFRTLELKLDCVSTHIRKSFRANECFASTPKPLSTADHPSSLTMVQTEHDRPLNRAQNPL